MADYVTPPNTKCHTCGVPIHNEDQQVRTSFDVGDLGQSGYFYFCSKECLLPWVKKTRDRMIEYADWLRETGRTG